MKLPSKELLSEVLHTKLELGDINRYYLIKDERHLLRLILTDKTDCWSYDINIYELSHECKEWAFDKGFVLKSYKKQGAFSGTYHYAIDINDKICEWLADTEYEAIFKACEWIMEHRK